MQPWHFVRRIAPKSAASGLFVIDYISCQISLMFIYLIYYLDGGFVPYVFKFSWWAFNLIRAY